VREVLQQLGCNTVVKECGQESGEWKKEKERETRHTHTHTLSLSSLSLSHYFSLSFSSTNLVEALNHDGTVDVLHKNRHVLDAAVLCCTRQSHRGIQSGERQRKTDEERETERERQREKEREREVKAKRARSQTGKKDGEKTRGDRPSTMDWKKPQTPSSCSHRCDNSPVIHSATCTGVSERDRERERTDRQRETEQQRQMTERD
jgi:hypothetical protein